MNHNNHIRGMGFSGTAPTRSRRGDPASPFCSAMPAAQARTLALAGAWGKTMEDPGRPLATALWSLEWLFSELFSVRYFSHFALLLRAFTRTCRIFSSLQLDGFHLLKPKIPNTCRVAQVLPSLPAVSPSLCAIKSHCLWCSFFNEMGKSSALGFQKMLTGELVQWIKKPPGFDDWWHNDDIIFSNGSKNLQALMFRLRGCSSYFWRQLRKALSMFPLLAAWTLWPRSCLHLTTAFLRSPKHLGRTRQLLTQTSFKNYAKRHFRIGQVYVGWKTSRFQCCKLCMFAEQIPGGVISNIPYPSNYHLSLYVSIFAIVEPLKKSM